MTNEKLYSDIISEKDVKSLLDLSDNDKENFLIYFMYNRLCNIPLDEMNHAQRTLYLAMKLEDACQADSLLSLSEEEEVFLALNDMKSALDELGAVKTAKALEGFISLVPENKVPEWSWFFEEERGAIIERLDGEISDYPDGLMSELYVKYISNPGAVELLLS